VPGRKRRRRRLSALLRFAVGIGLLAFIISRTGTARLRFVLHATSPAVVVAAAGLMALGVVVSAFRWSVFLRTLGYQRSTGYLTRLYSAGFFFNTFLPTGIGGDVFKALRVRNAGDPVGRGVASVLLDRLSGMVGLAVMGVVGASVRLASGHHERTSVAGLVLSAAVLLGMGAWLAAPGVVDRLAHRGGSGRIGLIVRSLDVAARHRPTAALGIAWGIVFQTCVVALNAVLLRGLHHAVPVDALVSVVVIVTFASLVPLTINGLGLREGAYVWSLGQLGVGRQVALALGLIVLGLLLAAAAVGGVVYAIGGADRPAEMREPGAG